MQRFVVVDFDKTILFSRRIDSKLFKDFEENPVLQIGLKRNSKVVRGRGHGLRKLGFFPDP